MDTLRITDCKKCVKYLKGAKTQGQSLKVPARSRFTEWLDEGAFEKYLNVFPAM